MYATHTHTLEASMCEIFFLFIRLNVEHSTSGDGTQKKDRSICFLFRIAQLLGRWREFIYVVRARMSLLWNTDSVFGVGDPRGHTVFGFGPYFETMTFIEWFSSISGERAMAVNHRAREKKTCLKHELMKITSGWSANYKENSIFTFIPYFRYFFFFVWSLILLVVCVRACVCLLLMCFYCWCRVQLEAFMVCDRFRWNGISTYTFVIWDFLTRKLVIHTNLFPFRTFKNKHNQPVIEINKKKIFKINESITCVNVSNYSK